MISMISILSTVLGFLFILPSLADPSPLTPAPGDSFKAGGDCLVTWAADATGVWNETNIYLMTGSDEVQTDLMRKYDT